MEQIQFVDETIIGDNEDIPNSQSSSNSDRIQRPKFSTPVGSQDLPIGSQELFQPSQTLSNISSPPPKKIKVTKFSKQDALDLLKKFEDKIETSRQILTQLAGTTFEDCNEEDAKEIQTAMGHLR